MMTVPNRLRTAVSAIAIVAMLSGCATSSRQSASTKVDLEHVGLAMRAQAALSSNQLAAAVDFAERAVEHTPDDAAFRALLGNCYFASGRFASAEAAYRDSLSLMPIQAPVILKLALVQIAQGKNAAAMGLLESARAALDPADYGLAVALAGYPEAAVAVLDPAARMTNADSRVRQNLALAYGLSGDWVMARTVASQDVPPDQLDSRIQQWMAMATPTRASDQVAALTGVTPSVDAGQPQRLALNAQSGSNALAQAGVHQQAPQPVVQPEFANVPAAPPPALPEPMYAPPALAVAPEPEGNPVAEEIVVARAADGLVQAPPAAEVRSAVLEQPASEEPKAPPVVAASAPAPVRDRSTSFKKKAAAFVAARGDRPLFAKRGSSVVQLGAYSSPERVSVAWAKLTKRYPALASYTPMRAKFDGPKGTVWRLSIKGFASRSEAADRCQTLRGRGGSCFVRQFAGDAPVQLASR